MKRRDWLKLTLTAPVRAPLRIPVYASWWSPEVVVTRINMEELKKRRFRLIDRPYP